MRLNASGNLGLGVTPSAWLNTRAFDIGTFGAVSCDTATSGVLSLAYNAYAEGASTWKYKGAGAAGLYQQTEAHKWFTAASGTAGNTISFTQAMTLDASGQLALGTSTASTTLGRNITINGANAGTNTGILLQSAGTERGYLYGSDSQVVFGSSTSIPAVFVTGGTERARITSGGDFGIGTTSPGQKLEVVGNIFINSSGNPYMEIKTSGAGNNPYLRLTASSTYWDIAGIFSDSTDPLQFAYGGSEKARIDSSGNLLVGKTTTSGTSGVGLLMAYDSASPTYVIVGSTSTSAANCIQAYSTGAGAYRFYVDYAGTVFATNTTISAISDQRFKENICDLDVGLDAVLALKPRKFDWKEGKGKDVKNDRGFIAQEFEQVFPDLVDEWKDPAPEGEEPYKSVRQDLIPVLVKAIQEQQAMINDLKAKVAALESK
jgi:hypothetical protein